jgi:putative component of toxin-antitoxin plasmid stabilization module
MFEVIKSETFDRWLCALRDARARARIEARSSGYRAGIQAIAEDWSS